MADSELNIFNLGSKGVNVDVSPIHLQDGELLVAQNATLDQHGYTGALRKRSGLVKHHTVAAAGSILGFTGVPLGPGPGSGSDDATAYYLANTAGTWFKSTDSFSTSSTITSLAASGFDVRSAMLNNRLYYSAGTTLRVFDGVKDALFSNINQTIANVSATNGLIYISTTAGFVFEIDAYGRAKQIGTVFPASYMPNDVIFHQNDLFVVATKAGSSSKVYRIRLSTALATTAWTDDGFNSAVATTAMTLASFHGLLYLATDTPTAAGSIVYERSTAAVYTAVDTGGANAGANSILVYKDQLYVHWDNYTGTDSVIRRSSNGTVWATVLTYTPVGGSSRADLFSTGSKLFALGDAQTIGYYSASGSAWTQFTVASAENPSFAFFKASGTGPAFGATSSFIVLQGSATLQLLNQAGTLYSLVMPTGITLDNTRPPRFTIYDKYVVVVNTPSRPITVDGEGIVRVLTPIPPVLPIGLASGGAGGLTGAYKALQSYIIKDAAGNIISESDTSLVMETAFAAAANTIHATGLNLSPEDITGSRIYRTTAGGDTYFPWIDVDGNTLTTSVDDDQSDASLSIVAAPSLGTPPNASLIASWRGRLWGVDRADIDYAKYSNAGIMYAWPNTNSILVGRAGSDARGITAFLARRDALGIGRRDSLHQITGTSNLDFRSVVLSETIGVESQETVIVYQDTAWFLSKDGVYKWNSEGIQCLSDDKVRSWFLTDTYFNRSRFPYAFASIDPVSNTYRLFLASAGSNTEDRWVEYNLNTETWWGPHKTDAFSLASAGFSTNSADRFLPLIGSTSGFLWKEQSTRTDNVETPIALDVTTMRHSTDTPDIEKYWGELTMLGVPQSAGALTITPSVGELNASAGSSFVFDLTKPRQRLQRIGVGKHVQLRLQESTAGQDVILTGYQLPDFEVGRR